MIMVEEDMAGVMSRKNPKDPLTLLTYVVANPSTCLLAFRILLFPSTHVNEEKSLAWTILTAREIVMRMSR